MNEFEIKGKGMERKIEERREEGETEEWTRRGVQYKEKRVHGGDECEVGEKVMKIDEKKE